MVMGLKLYQYYVGNSPEELHNHLIRILLGIYFIVLEKPNFRRWEDGLEIELKLREMYNDNETVINAYTDKIKNINKDNPEFISNILKTSDSHFTEFYGKDIGPTIHNSIKPFLLKNDLDGARKHIENAYLSWFLPFSGLLQAQIDLIDIKTNRLSELTQVHISDVKHIKTYKHFSNGQMLAKRDEVKLLLKNLGDII